MSRATNVAVANVDPNGFPVPEAATETRKNAKGQPVSWRLPDGVLYTSRRDPASGELKQAEVVFSISAGVSERFSVAIDDALEAHNRTLSDDPELWDKGTQEGHKTDVTRAQYVRVLVADSIEYDISLEPVRERTGEGLKEYHERQKQKVSGFDKIALGVLADPDLKAKLEALGITF